MTDECIRARVQLQYKACFHGNHQSELSTAEPAPDWGVRDLRCAVRLLRSSETVKGVVLH